MEMNALLGALNIMPETVLKGDALQPEGFTPKIGGNKCLDSWGFYGFEIVGNSKSNSSFFTRTVRTVRRYFFKKPFEVGCLSPV